jgi:nicotinate-nucleotide--dimethylbenzimidazole phosphoribosyltransferase
VSEALDLYAFEDLVHHGDEEARTAARTRQRQLLKPPGSLGLLEDLGTWLAGVQGQSPPAAFRRVRAVLFAGDHGITAAGVSAYPSSVTGQTLRAMVTGNAAVNVLARQVDATVRVLDICVDDAMADVPEHVVAHKVRRGTGRIDIEDACSRDEAEQAFQAGMRVADEEIDAGADLLVAGDLGVGNSTPAAVLTGLLTASDAASVCGRGSGIDDRAWMRKAAAIRDAMRRTRPYLGDLLHVLASGAGPDFAAMTGFYVQAAVRRTPVVIDGTVSAACALAAYRVSFRASDWWVAGFRSGEPSHGKALNEMSLIPLLEREVDLGQATSGLLAVPLLKAAQATLAEMATLEEAGVSEPGDG